MTETEFREWVGVYCTATGSSAAVSQTLLANYRVFSSGWRATLVELGEVVYRLVSGLRVPNWPAEHLPAIGKELEALRVEIASTLPKHETPSCGLCARGMVVVPHPCCVYQGRVVPYYNPATKQKRNKVYTVAVTCMCPAGDSAARTWNEYADERRKPRPLTLEGWLKRCGRDLEPTVMLRKWEAEQAELSRRVSPRSDVEDGIFRRALASIIERQKEWTNEPVEGEVAA